MEFIQAQVLSVTGKTTSRGLVYEIQMGNGTTYSTWDAATANKANALAGQVADASVETTQNTKDGRTYTNHKLLDIAAVGGLGAVAQPVAPGVAVQAAPVGSPNGIPMQAPDPRVPDVEKQRMITRQNVLRTAFDFVGKMYEGAGPESLEAAKAEALTIASELYAKVYAQPAAQSQPVQLPAAATPAEVAAEVNQAAGAEVVAVGAQASPEPDW